jgi:hypothetical protein
MANARVAAFDHLSLPEKESVTQEEYRGLSTTRHDEAVALRSR